jgi:TetR/AcrR family transcriptional repressor of nem operon
VKVTKQKAAEHRAAIVAAAGRLFRESGFDGVGIAEIMRAAGLTHGAFYGHFASKEALAEAACNHGFAESRARLAARLDGPDGNLGRHVESYLSERHRDRPGRGCPMAAYATEIPHQHEALQRQFAAGVESYVDRLAEGLPATAENAADRRRRAVATVAALVGGMALARATAQASPELSEEILAAVRNQMEAAEGS